MDIIILSTADWEHPFWTNKQHTAKQLAELGHNVLYIDSLGLRRIVTTNSDDKNRIIKKFKNFFKSPLKISENLYVFSPLIIPIHDNLVISKVNAFFLSICIKLICVKLNFRNPIFWSFNPMSYDIATLLNPKCFIYNNVDDLIAAPGMPKSLPTKEIDQIKKSDIIFNTSSDLQKKCISLNKNSYEFTNVADYEHFSKARLNSLIPSDISSYRKPIIGFIGAISPYKVDFALLTKYAKENPDKTILLIGKVGEGQPETEYKLSSISNLVLLGPKLYSELPNYLAAMDVLIIPSVINDYTNAMFPMKFFEYLATEKPIVAKKINSLETFRDVFYSYETYDEFCECIDKSLTIGHPNQKLGNDYAQLYTWKNRLNSMLLIINKHFY